MSSTAAVRANLIGRKFADYLANKDDYMNWNWTHLCFMKSLSFSYRDGYTSSNLIASFLSHLFWRYCNGLWQCCWPRKNASSTTTFYNVLVEDVFVVDFKSFFTLICLRLPPLHIYLMEVTLMDIKYTLSMCLMIIDECFYDYRAANAN